MTTYHDPRAELDYSDFHAVNDDQKATVIAKGIDADYCGPLPRETPYAPGEREAFQAVRDRLDRAMQAVGVRPNTPQTWQTPEVYEASLLRVLAKHTSGRLARMSWSPQETPAGVIATCEKYNVIADALTEPARQGRLATIKTVDVTGRETFEFVGDKGVWLGPLKGPAFVSAVHLDGQPQRA